MSKQRYWSPVCAMLALLTGPAAGSAQSASDSKPQQDVRRTDYARAYVSPTLGIFVPMGPLVADRTLKLSNISTLAFGSRLGYRVTSRFALEASLAWAPSQVARQNWNSVTDINAGNLVGGVEALALVYEQHNKGDEYLVLAGGGAAALRRFGEAWEGMGSVTRPAGLLSMVVRYRQAGSRIAYTGVAQDVISRTPYRSQQGTTHAGLLHHGLMVTVGASIPLMSNVEKQGRGHVK